MGKTKRNRNKTCGKGAVRRDPVCWRGQSKWLRICHTLVSTIDDCSLWDLLTVFISSLNLIASLFSGWPVIFSLLLSVWYMYTFQGVCAHECMLRMSFEDTVSPCIWSNPHSYLFLSSQGWVCKCIPLHLPFPVGPWPSIASPQACWTIFIPRPSQSHFQIYIYV